MWLQYRSGTVHTDASSGKLLQRPTVTVVRLELVAVPVLVDVTVERVSDVVVVVEQTSHSPGHCVL